MCKETNDFQLGTYCDVRNRHYRTVRCRIPSDLLKVGERQGPLSAYITTHRPLFWGGLVMELLKIFRMNDEILIWNHFGGKNQCYHV